MLKIPVKSLDQGYLYRIYDGTNKYEFTSAISTIYEDLGGYIPIGSNIGESTPVLLNGEYYLPWHVSAALGNQGFDAWIDNKTDKQILEVLWYLKYLYENNGFNVMLAYLNKIVAKTSAYVY